MHARCMQQACALCDIMRCMYLTLNIELSMKGAINKLVSWLYRISFHTNIILYADDTSLVESFYDLMAISFT